MLITRRSLIRGALAAPAIVLASRLDFVPRGLAIRRNWTLADVHDGGTIRYGLPRAEWMKLVMKEPGERISDVFGA